MQMLGHDGPPQSFWRENLVTDEPLARCPVRTLQLARESDLILAREVERYDDTLYPAYRDGHLLVKGGIGDQPARYLEIINLVRHYEISVEAKATELAKRETES